MRTFDASDLRPAAVFLGWLLALEVVAGLLARVGALRPLVWVYVRATAALAELMGVPATVDGAGVRLPTRMLTIDMECTGVYLFAAYVALVFASRRTVMDRLIGITVGIPGLALANLIRLALVIQASEHIGESAFLFVHDYLFQVLFVAAVVAIWAAWASRSASHAA